MKRGRVKALSAKEGGAAFGMLCKGTWPWMLDGALCNRYSRCGMEEKQREGKNAPPAGPPPLRSVVCLLPASSSCLPCFLYDGSFCPNDDGRRRQRRKRKEGEGRRERPRRWSTEQRGWGRASSLLHRQALRHLKCDLCSLIRLK